MNGEINVWKEILAQCFEDIFCQVPPRSSSWILPVHKWRVWTRKNIWCRCVINLTKPTKNDNWMFKNIPGDWTRHLRVRDALVSHDFMNGTTLKPPLLVKVFSWLHTISWLYACSLSLLSGTHLTLVVGRHNGKVHCTRTYSNPTNITTYQSTFGIFDIPSLVWHTFISVTYLHNCDIPS